jgi:deoxyribodipyrimidine photolyase
MSAAGRAEERVCKAMEKEGVHVKYFWGSTLYHVEDLPFRLEAMPSNYGGFREAVKGLEVRKVLEALMRNVLEPGDIPTLGELGLKATPAAMAHVSLLQRWIVSCGTYLDL